MQVGRRSAVVLRKSAAGQHKQGSDPHHFLSLFFSFFVFFAFSFLLFAYLFSRSTLNRLRVHGVLVLIRDGSSTARMVPKGPSYSSVNHFFSPFKPKPDLTRITSILNVAGSWPGLGKLTSRPDFFIITAIFSIGIFALSCICIY